MKKLKKVLRFFSISFIVFVFLSYFCRFLFNLIWNFDLWTMDSYQTLYNYWENGGVFNTFRDISLGTALILLPVFWLLLSRKLYKYGFFKFIFYPVIKLYRWATRPKNMEPEHVSIKNLGGKDKTLDEIISKKIEEKGGKTGDGHTSQNLRRQIAAKIEENEKQ